MKRRSVDRLGKAMRWAYKTDNKMRGNYGETDYAKKTIRINKKLSNTRPMFKRPVNKGATKYPDVLGTIVHELHHKSHPKATEQQTIKAERRKVARLTPKQKKRLYAKFS